MNDWLFSIISAPCVIFFSVIALGCILGRIHFFGISLDLSGVLILAITVGGALSCLAPPLLIKSLENDAKFLSSLGTALFISAIGISSDHMLSAEALRKGWTYLLAGALIVINGYLLIFAIAQFDSDADSSLLSGALCGAMTSTPGLSAMTELKQLDSARVTSGYACAYPIGVMGIVLFVQMVLRKNAMPQIQQEIRTETDKPPSPASELFQTAAVIAAGCILGEVKIPLLESSLGNAGGILIAGLLFGALSQHHNKRKLSQSTLAFLRTLGLLLFFAGTGISSGAELLNAFRAKYLIYAGILTCISILGSYLVLRVLFRKTRTQALSIVCGGMTSTPAIGLVSRKSEEQPDLSAYAFTYIGALLVMVLGTRIFPL